MKLIRDYNHERIETGIRFSENPREYRRLYMIQYRARGKGK